MTNLKTYLQDGADAQSRATLMLLQERGNIEASWDKETQEYEAQPKVARWENNREQGYIISLRSKNRKRQLNVAFFTHRNSDSPCAIKWEQNSINSLTINTSDFGEVYQNKGDVSYEGRHGEILKLTDWIYEQLTEFWKKTSTIK